jgi:hypothetical protein
VPLSASLGAGSLGSERIVTILKRNEAEIISEKNNDFPLHSLLTLIELSHTMRRGILWLKRKSVSVLKASMRNIGVQNQF